MLSRKKSILWNYFDLCEDRKYTTICKFCKNFISVKGNATGNLRKHLHRKHPDVLIDLLSDREGDEANEEIQKLKEYANTNNNNTLTVPTKKLKIKLEKIFVQDSKMTTNLQNETDPEDEDLIFFQSLLVNIKELNIRRRRQFRMLVLNTLNKMLDEQDDALLASSASSETLKT